MPSRATAIVLLFLAPSVCLGQDIPDAIPLWPDGAPGATGTAAADIPALWVYPVDKNPKAAAVVICPGGGYRVHAVDHEGHQVARWFNRKGITAVVLRYRLGPKYHHPAPLMDAQRAIRYVRQHASEWGVSPERVGIMGFSAGGHLASTAATHFEPVGATAGDPVDQHPSRPDFAVLGYPVISLAADFAHRGSGRNLLGENPDPQLLRNLSNETQVTAQTPPCFLFHTFEDTAVHPDNSITFFQALRQAGVPAELHIYRDGPHGVGLANGHPAVGSWPDRLYDWMKSSGLLVRTPRLAADGTVSVDGSPLAWGTIAIVPTNPDAPTAWAPVRRGKFTIPLSRGVTPGVNRVEIYDLGDVQPRPTIADALRIDDGSLTVDASADHKTFDLQLTTK